MSRVHVIKSVQLLPVSLETAWAYFSDPRNLLSITPPSLNLRVTNEVFGQKMYPGQVLLYTVKPLLGIPFSWMTEITHVEPMRFFIDEQRKGPYKLWHHQHHFRTVDGGVEMTDIVHYRLPLGWLGHLAHGPLVRKKLEEIFTYRYQKITALFGQVEGSRMSLSIS